MRRWILWSGGLILVAVLALIVAAISLGKPGTPFDFLAGGEAYVIVVRGKQVEDYERYSLEGDFEDVHARARKELLARGYEEIAVGDHVNTASYGIGDWRKVIMSLPPYPPGAQVVTIIDTKVEEMTPLGQVPPKGVTVHIHGQAPRSLFDRVRAWMGL